MAVKSRISDKILHPEANISYFVTKVKFPSQAKEAEQLSPQKIQTEMTEVHNQR